MTTIVAAAMAATAGAEVAAAKYIVRRHTESEPDTVCFFVDSHIFIHTLNEAKNNKLLFICKFRHRMRKRKEEKNTANIVHIRLPIHSHKSAVKVERTSANVCLKAHTHRV